MLEYVSVNSPIEGEIIERLKVGTMVLISGVIYTARDAAHKRMVQALQEGEKLPFDIKGQTI